MHKSKKGMRQSIACPLFLSSFHFLCALSVQFAKHAAHSEFSEMRFHLCRGSRLDLIMKINKNINMICCILEL